MLHYNSYRAVLKARFGKPVLKVPVNAGFSCPNRDGTKSVSGCLFCDNRAFSPVAQQPAQSPIEQLLRATGNNKNDRLLLPYLQPFSNTYGPVDLLRKTYEPLLTVAGVIGLAIGTRPDCFTEDTFNYLADLSRRTYLSIELGLQSAHDATLARCNRGHTFADFSATVKRIASDGIETVAHVMLGLPAETEAMMQQTAVLLAESPCTGVKIHQLMIIDKTEFSDWYRSGTLQVFTLERYAEILSNFIMHLRPDQHIHRIIADATLENGLMAPLWSADKMGSLRYIHQYLDKHAIVQGKLHLPHFSTRKCVLPSATDWESMYS